MGAHAVSTSPGRGLVLGANRRAFLRQLGVGSLGSALGVVSAGESLARGTAGRLAPADDAFLDELERVTFQFFLEAAHPRTGQVLDRRRADGEVDSRGVGSIAATGFGLTALCVAEERGWLPRHRARALVLKTLRHLWHEMRHVRGFYFHFHDWATGARIWKCELSSIDTAILMCGVLCCRAHFGGRREREIRDLATALYQRVDWPWMLNGGETFSMGWFPEATPGETGEVERWDGNGGRFLESRWDHYCELMMLYLLAMGSPTHPIGVRHWRAWSRPVREYFGQTFVWSPAPLFVHQFSHAWFDFRGRRDAGVDWFENSVAATRAHRAWCLDQAQASRFPEWSDDVWGVTSSDSAKGYTGWGGPPDSGPLDGTIVPCAAAGSLPFLPNACLRTLRHQKERYGDRIWKRYGFVDAWNPHDGWVNPDVVGIDLGITLLMAENLRSGFVWRTMGEDPAVRLGMKRALGAGP